MFLITPHSQSPSSSSSLASEPSCCSCPPVVLSSPASPLSFGGVSFGVSVSSGFAAFSAFSTAWADDLFFALALNDPPWDRSVGLIQTLLFLLLDHQYLRLSVLAGGCQRLVVHGEERSQGRARLPFSSCSRAREMRYGAARGKAARRRISSLVCSALILPSLRASHVPTTHASDRTSPPSPRHRKSASQPGPCSPASSS